MPRLRILISMASPDTSFTPGDIIDLSADEAKRFIDAGIAEPADQVRTASADLGKVENTSKKIGKKVL